MKSQEYNHELPSPDMSASQPNAGIADERQAATQIESNATQMHQAPQQSSQPVQQPTSQQGATPSYVQANQPLSQSSSSPQIADDVDIIEPEWVEKAKEIVNNTKNDPRQQNKEMNKLKADYLKKRYNRTVKLEE